MDEQKEQDPNFESSGRYTYYLKSKKQIILNNFLGGIAWGIGTFIGLGVIAAIIGYVFKQVDVAAALANWLAKIVYDTLQQIPPTK